MSNDSLAYIVIGAIVIALILAFWRGQSMQPRYAEDPCNSIATCTEFKEYEEREFLTPNETVVCLNKKPYSVYQFDTADWSSWRIVVNQESCSLLTTDEAKTLMQNTRFFEANSNNNPFRNVWSCSDIVIKAGGQLNCHDATKLTNFMGSNSENIRQAADASSSLSTILKKRDYIDRETEQGVKQVAKLAKWGTSEDVLFAVDVFRETSCGIGTENSVEALTIASVGANLMDRVQQASFYDGGLEDVRELANGLVNSERICNEMDLKNLAQSTSTSEREGSDDYSTSNSRLGKYKAVAQETIDNMTTVKDKEGPKPTDYLFYQYSAIYGYNLAANGVNGYFERGLYISAKNNATTAIGYYSDWRSKEEWQKLLLLIEIGAVLYIWHTIKVGG